MLGAVPFESELDEMKGTPIMNCFSVNQYQHFGLAKLV